MTRNNAILLPLNFINTIPPAPYHTPPLDEQQYRGGSLKIVCDIADKADSRRS